MGMKTSIKLAILTPSVDSYSETFIRNHITYLPFDKVVIYGDDIPYKKSEQDSYIEKYSLIERVFFRLFPGKRKSNRELKLNALKKALTSEGVNVVMAEYVSTAANVYEVCQQLNIPIIATGLGFDLSIYSVLSINESRYKSFLKYTTGVVVVAKYMREVLLELGCDSSKIHYSPIGATAEFFEITPSSHKGNEILAVGRFVEKKAPHLTILAFYHTLKQVPDAKLLMAGDGPLLQFCEDLVKGLDISERVEFLGRVNQKKQRQLLSNCSLFVQHSRTAANGDREGTPVAILEASAAAVPVVSTRHAGIVDVVVENQTGFLVDEGDVHGMAKHMSDLLLNSDVAKKLGMQGMSYVRDNLTLDSHIRQLTKIIESAVNN
jgi:colanic acid/amylovoran biosynthesis glycosyltransferase